MKQTTTTSEVSAPVFPGEVWRETHPHVVHYVLIEKVTGSKVTVRYTAPDPEDPRLTKPGVSKSKGSAVVAMDRAGFLSRFERVTGESLKRWQAKREAGLARNGQGKRWRK